MGFWNSIFPIIREADVLLILADARMPELSRNIELEDIVRRHHKPFFIVYTKIDLISKEELNKLMNNYPDAFFISGLKNKGLSTLRRELMIERKRMKVETIRVGIFGYPNVGKSSLINCFARGARTQVSSIAGTTKGPQFVRVGSIKIIDSPGVIPYSDKESNLGLIAAKNPEKLRNPDRVAHKIINILKPNEDSYEIFLAFGKKRGFLKKGGEVDERKTALFIVQHWQRGDLRAEAF